jgi:hypothetical protein
LQQPAAVLFRTPALYRTTACFYHSFEKVKEVHPAGYEAPLFPFPPRRFFDLFGLAVKKNPPAVCETVCEAACFEEKIHRSAESNQWSATKEVGPAAHEAPLFPFPPRRFFDFFGLAVTIASKTWRFYPETGK